MAAIIFVFMMLCMAVGGCFLVVKGSRENRISLVVIGAISILIVLAIVYIIYSVSGRPWGIG